MIDINDDELAQIIRILKAHLTANTKVYAFGSRTSGKARVYSDLDLLIMADKALEYKDKMALQEAFSESNLVFRVDISDWHAISDPFKNAIKTKLKRIL